MVSIQSLLDEEHWSLLSWRERYGKLIWVAIAPSKVFLDHMERVNTGPDLPSVDLSFFLHGGGAWLPISNAETFGNALGQLEAKLSRLSLSYERQHEWELAVQAAYERIIELSLEDPYAIRRAVESRDPTLFASEHF